ncbi:hypothetical protein FRACYDRAFT_246241 [Fragilariopsis cylindrus CCMP1102]|uniref:Uncharacterized protein n=1 Tax=Fragilariopsis cylindrus CCMP1102 TaxID=635003 RepID=A0A1E7EZ74_9STRA|nr:hypothetical protein FRACYDRAFT_246241 [Fragilariopsis cylindrus CCMP1102]|eukprot:OEU11129.1 hypothetical protein FRACYDRAFT_246241 [Fragilariopsis cylindrus CCMP1102]
MTGNNNTTTKSNKRNYEEYYNVDKEDPQRKKQKILKDKHKFPLLIRRKIDKLIVATFVTEDDFFNATAFIQGVCNAIHILLCHVGLNINRESMNEVEFAIRLFPRVLSMKWQQDDDYNNNSSAGYYPISLQTTQNGYRNCRECLPHGGVFLPLLIRLAIEFGIFKNNYEAVIEETLIDCGCYNEYDNGTSNSCTSNTTLGALFLAATDKKIHLDGVYFLLQSDPDLAQKLLSMMINSSTTTTITTNSIDNDNDKDDNNDAGGGSMMN